MQFETPSPQKKGSTCPPPRNLQRASSSFFSFLLPKKSGGRRGQIRLQKPPPQPPTLAVTALEKKEEKGPRIKAFSSHLTFSQIKPIFFPFLLPPACSAFNPLFASEAAAKESRGQVCSRKERRSERLWPLQVNGSTPLNSSCRVVRKSSWEKLSISLT